MWNQSDKLLLVAIRAKVAEMAPGWDIKVGDAHFDWFIRRRVYLYNVELKAEGQQDTIATIPEIVLTIDTERFEERQEVDVTKVEVLRSRVFVNRDADGVWNWQALPEIKKSDKSLPEISFQEGTVRVRLAQTDGSQPATMVLEHANVDLIPSGKREYRIQGATQIEQAGKINFDAKWNVDTKSWLATGNALDVAADDKLVALAARTSSQLRTKLRDADRALRKLARLPPVESETGNTAFEVPDFGFGATLDIEFRLTSPQRDESPRFAVAIDVRQGHVTNPALPFPLHDVTGKLIWDNDQFEVRQLSAKFGMTRLAVNGKIQRAESATPARFAVKLFDLVLDSQLRAHLPKKWQKIYDSLQPAGHIDLAVVLDFDGRGKFRHKGLFITAKNCSGRHERFRYPVRSVSGTVEQRGDVLVMNFSGLAGNRRASLEGYMRNPGPLAESSFDIRVKRLPIDNTFVSACTKPSQRKTLRLLGLTGVADIHCHLFRPAGLKRKFAMHLVADLNDATLEFEHFKWRLNRLSGRVTFDSPTRHWTFKDLKAAHGDAVVTGDGSFVQNGLRVPGQLELKISARQAHLDGDLERALQNTLPEIWDELSPKGRIDLDTTIKWSPGTPVDIVIDRAEIDEGRLLLKAFPYPLDDVRVKFSYVNRRIEVKSLEGVHGNSVVKVNNLIGDWWRNGAWRIRLNEVIGDDIDPSPNSMFRQAFGKQTALRGMLEELNPRGLVSFSGMLEFRGNKQEPNMLTAAWDQKIVLSGNSLSVGVDLERLSGEVIARGTVDQHGYVLMNEGNRIDLNHVEFWGYSFSQVRGPYQLEDRQLIVGSKDAFAARRDSAKPKTESADHLTANAFGGTFALDLVAVLQEKTSYRLRAKLSNGRLEQYARLYLPGVKNLRGIMDGWIDLAGRGPSPAGITGRGQMRIRRAALYELPVIVQIFKLLSFVPSDNTAFRYAMANFKVRDEKFHFDSIDLVGDTMSLRGHGTAGFDEMLNLAFYSQLPNQARSIPIVGVFVNQATKGWVGVTVTGRIGAPIAHVRAVPQLDDALQQFLRAFDARPSRRLPRLIAPPLWPTPPGSLDARRHRPIR